MEQLKMQIIKLINESQLTPEMIYYVTKDVYRDVVEFYQNYLIQQQKQNETTNNKEEE